MAVVSMDIEVISFEEAMERFMPYLKVNAEHTEICEHLRAYRNHNDYLSIKINNIGMDFHKSYAKEILTSPAAQAHLRQAYGLLAEHEASIAPGGKDVKVTMEEIAEKLGIPVEKLIIKQGRKL